VGYVWSMLKDASWEMWSRCPQRHRRPRAGSAEGRDWLGFNGKEGFRNWLMAILAREGTVCHSLQGWMRGWMWKGRGLGGDGRIVIDVSGDFRAGCVAVGMSYSVAPNGNKCVSNTTPFWRTFCHKGRIQFRYGRGTRNYNSRN